MSNPVRGDLIKYGAIEDANTGWRGIEYTCSDEMDYKIEPTGAISGCAARISSC